MTPLPGGRADPRAGALLAEHEREARWPLVAAAGVLVVAIAAVVVQSWAVASIAQAALRRQATAHVVLEWLAVLLAATAVRAAATTLAGLLAAEAARRAKRSVRAELVEAVLARSGPVIASGRAASLLLEHVERLDPYYSRYLPLRAAAAVTPLVILPVAFGVNWFVGMIMLIATPMVPVNMWVVGVGAESVSRHQLAALRRLSGQFLDRLQGRATLRRLGAGGRELAHVAAGAEELSRRTMAILRVGFLSSAVLELITTVAIAVVATYVGLTLLGYVQIAWLPTDLSLRTGLFLLLLVPAYFQPLRALAAAYHERSDALAAAEALLPLATCLPAAAAPSPAGRLARTATAPAIEILDVTVRFPERERPALDGVRAELAPCRVLAITGATGAGKSTLLNVLSGALEPTAGRVRIGGRGQVVDGAHNVAWVGQRPYLFPGTLGENIALADPAASRAAVFEAARRAQLEELLGMLPAGLDTPIGERGAGLSGGERQRVAVARAFLCAAPLVLLDEPTAHLDAAGELGLLGALAELARGRTVVMATHSSRAIALADEQLVLDRGRRVG